MIFLKTDKENIVNFINYMPFDSLNGLNKTKEELELEGVLIESLPEPLQQLGKYPVLYCNSTTKQLWYEYKDAPKTAEQIQKEKINNLEAENEQLNLALAETVEKQERDKTELQLAMAQMIENGGIING